MILRVQVILFSVLVTGLAAAEPPYPPSALIESVEFDWSTHQRDAEGSDNWAITWGGDDKQYATWGDGWGFNESGSKQSLGVSSISGASSSWTGTDLWSLPTAGSPGGKSYGILSVDGVLFMWVGPGSGTTSYDEARIYKSSNHGVTWEQADWSFTKTQGLIMPTFLNFGNDYSGARDGYVYAYFIRLQGNPSQLGVMVPGMIDLARVPKDQIMSQGAWEFFAGFSNSQPTWSTDPTNRQPVFEDSNGVGWNLSVSYSAPLGRYILSTEHAATFEGRLGMFEAPEPWGPWTTIHYAEQDGQFGNGQIDTTAFYWNFSNKWLNSDGKNFVMVFSGIGSNDSFNLVEGSFSIADTVPLYETFELVVPATGVTGNEFSRFVSATFTKDSRSFDVDGFYDGDNTWRVRFMPDEEGVWSYTWTFDGDMGEGLFTCTSLDNPKNHGHVHRDPDHPRYLVHGDGTPHYWFGGKWIAAGNFGPEMKGGESNTSSQFAEGYYSDSELLDYLDHVAAFQHNGLLLKMALFPLENDKISWDLDWIHRGEWLVREMKARGIYCQINLFDTWSRGPDSWFEYITNGPDQVFNVWAPGDEAAKENYLRTIIARFSGYSNVYWELGNEMEHSPNSGSGFVSQANTNYIPWIHQYDPYDLPIGLSEGVWTSADVDIGFLHQTHSLPAVSTNGNRPNIMNELVFGWPGGDLWRDSTIRDGANRLGYRRTFWRMFVYGGSGTGQATWLDIETPLNSAVLDVMGDQQRLREFIDELPTNINEMETDTSFIISGPGENRTRAKPGETYVTYFLLDPGESTGPGNVNLSLPSGDYEIRWYDPKTGAYVSSATVSADGSTTIGHPAFTEDITLRVAAIPKERHRVVVSTDIGGSDNDDFQSMVHFLVYTDLFDVEGLISSPPFAGRATHIQEAIDAYELDYQWLKQHAENYPDPSDLRAVVKQGATETSPPAGYGTSTEGSDWLIARARVADDRPVYVLVWGSITDIAQAVHDAPDIKQKLRVYSIGSWNTSQDRAARDYLYDNHPDLWWIECDSTFRGMYVGGNQQGDLGNRSFLEAHVSGHGALGQLLVNKLDAIKMGDTPSVLYLLSGDTADPTGQHWGGSFVSTGHGPNHWSDSPEPTLAEGPYPGAKTVNRWREAYLRDWQERMDRALPVVTEPTCTIESLYNTGVDDSRLALTGIAVDTHWTLVTSPDSEWDGPETYTTASIPSPPWIVNNLNSRWITPRSDNSSVGGGVYSYRTTFDLSLFDPSTAYVSGRFTADDWVLEIYLNDQLVGESQPAGAYFANWHSFGVTTGFVSGPNTLDFVVDNAGTDANPSGFRVEFTEAYAVPLPGNECLLPPTSTQTPTNTSTPTPTNTLTRTPTLTPTKTPKRDFDIAPRSNLDGKVDAKDLLLLLELVGSGSEESMVLFDFGYDWRSVSGI